MSLRVARVSALLVMGLICAAAQPEVTPLPIIPDMVPIVRDGMPSFGQRNPAFSGGGIRYCGPTAASNALMWLADHGYPKLKPQVGDAAKAQTEMIQRLANYMGTFHEGTSVDSFASGIRSYIGAAGYASRAWLHSGNRCASRVLEPPDVHVMGNLTDGKTVMWLSVGWYSLDGESKKYHRDHGHWLTLVGYGTNQCGETDSNSLVIADPEAPNGMRFVTLAALNQGRISDGLLKTDAKGYFGIPELNAQRPGGGTGYCILETIEGMTLQ
jgi:hypothetical protein